MKIGDVIEPKSKVAIVEEYFKAACLFFVS